MFRHFSKYFQGGCLSAPSHDKKKREVGCLMKLPSVDWSKGTVRFLDLQARLRGCASAARRRCSPREGSQSGPTPAVDRPFSAVSTPIEAKSGVFKNLQHFSRFARFAIFREEIGKLLVIYF